MTETAITTAPLTRREAREIERRTGRRPVAAAVAPVSLPLVQAPVALVTTDAEDTAKIERNADLAMVSILPTEVLTRVAERVAPVSVESSDEAAAFVRPVSIRAARPAALVARSRRRAVTGLGVAASAAVLATAAISVPGAVAAQNDQQAAQAALVTADVVADGDAQVAAPAAEAAAPVANLVAAPESATNRAEYSVASFDATAVEEVVVAPATGTSSTGETSTGSNTSGGTQTASTGGGGYSTSGVAATAESYVGTGHGWQCDYFVMIVMAEHGISMPRGVSAQAAMGTPTSNPQPGDLVVWPGEHIGIYAGNGMVIDNPGYGGLPVKMRSISWGNPYFVTLN